MRTALDPGRLRTLYDRLAAHYDIEHALLTGHSDQRARRLLVREAVSAGDRVLDAGAGTGSTALLAARRTGADGRLTLLDASPGMLAVARRRIDSAGLGERCVTGVGDLLAMPFPDACFDVALSTFSLCPVYDPAAGARELWRVVRPGGRLGIAHSIDPPGAVRRWLGTRIEALVWHLPAISMGCRAVEVAPALEALGARILLDRTVGVPLWPFRVLVLERR
ncbi:MAG TPA: methyltransferase domain-containing protein [Gammaproteobacteria bacterium]|nr:methyltransferase domain-containing protein [Gammaproteobacteria bacterium]